MSERDYRRSTFHGFKPYVAGKPIEEVERELGLSIPIAKLASNENPLGPSPKAIAAIQEILPRLHLYPHDDSWYYRQAVARHHGVAFEEVFGAAGSVEVIELCAHVFLEAGDQVVTSEKTFAIYTLATMKAGADLVRVPCRDRYWYDLEAIRARITPRTKLIFLANPNNPTGTWFSRDAFDAFMESIPEDILVVYDEAYCHYITRDDLPDAWAWLQKGRDVLILRTFSKSHGLAGLRLGYAVGPARIVSGLIQGRTAFNLSSLAQAAGVAALEDTEFVERSRRFNAGEMAWMGEALQDLPVTVPPSQTNFYLVDTDRDAQVLFGELQKRGVIVRPMGGYQMPHAIRVNMGLRAENERFVEALGALLR
ncbi:MAG: histidinol-phosphate transaminase [Deltaproteobacteria bacterium]|nr:histidinol-phosphate transaminase [Deltaproteobacteria bacterium]